MVARAREHQVRVDFGDLLDKPPQPLACSPPRVVQSTYQECAADEDVRKWLIGTANYSGHVRGPLARIARIANANRPPDNMQCRAT